MRLRLSDQNMMTNTTIEAITVEQQKANHVKVVSLRYFLPTSVIGKLIFL